MIPCRLCLSGFMSYREEKVLSFRGASLWALAGENGAGKTALFDAIFFALYGEHRLEAKEKAQQLIHKACRELVVEFDFVVGEEEYRIRRTMSRGSTTRTRQAWHLQRPSRDQNDVMLEPIAETHRESGLKAWVKQVVGLDSRAFTFSVWLQQGKSDALLTATAQERQHLISQIIDLSAYERLYQRAEEGYKQWEVQARSNEARLLQLEPIEEQRLEAIKGGEQQAQLGKQAAKERHIGLAELRIRAQRWQECEKARKHSLQALSTAEVLLAHAPQIEQDVLRVRLLNEVLPLLEEILQRRSTFAQQRTSLSVLQQKQQQQASVIEREKAAYRGLQEELEQCREVRKQQQEGWKCIEQRLGALEPAIRQINLLEAMRNQARSLQEQVKTIDPALDENYQQVRQELEELEALRRVLPWLRQFVTARQKWNQWGKELTLLASQQPELEIRLKQWQNEQEGCLARRDPLKEQEEHLLQEVTRAETLLLQCKQREKKFREIDGKGTCSYCGQDLTPKHLEMERQKVSEELQQRREGLQYEQQHFKQWQKQYEKEQTSLQKAQQTVQETEQALKVLRDQRTLLTNQRREAETQAQAALQETPDLFLSRIQDGETKPLPLSNRLQTIFPSEEELVVMQRRVARKNALSAQLHRLQSKRDEKQRLVTQYEYACQQLLEKEKTFPVEEQRSLKEVYGQVQQERKVLAEQIAQMHQRIEQLEHGLQEQGGGVQKSEQALQKLVEQIIVTQRDSEHTSELIKAKEEALPMDWRQPAAQISQKGLDAWKKEKEVLGDAASRLEGVRAAQRDVQLYRQRLAELDTEKEKTPVEAQRSVKDLDREIARVVQIYEQYEQEHQRFQREKTYVEEVCRQRQLWQQQFQEARHKAVLYKELRRLLSAEYLQHFLIQKAEQGIVSAANEFLDRLSGGTLRLGLKGETGQEAKMLDLVGYHQAISTTEPQHVLLLSGGQKFQISVSLALGIGKYTGEGTQRVETIIIDEGFGGLDEKRRQAMVQGLQDLQTMFKCIIVVSHQAEFCEQFENRYYVWLEDECSKVSLRDERMDAQELETAG